MWLVLQTSQHSLYVRYTQYFCLLDRSQILRLGELLQTVHVTAPQQKQETGHRKSRRLWFKTPLKDLASESVTTLTGFKTGLSQSFTKQAKISSDVRSSYCGQQWRFLQEVSLWAYPAYNLFLRVCRWPLSDLRTLTHMDFSSEPSSATPDVPAKEWLSPPALPTALTEEVCSFWEEGLCISPSLQ